MNSINMTVTEVVEVNSDVFMELNKFGKFQCIQYILICLSIMMVSMTNVNYIFVAQDVDHRCLVPKCEDLNPVVEKPHWWPNDVDVRCFQPVVDEEKYLQNDKCSNETFYKELYECHEWVYENNDSVVSVLNLACQPWKISLIGSIHNAGMLLAMMISGILTDKLGRKPTLIIIVSCGVVGLTKMFVTNFYLYLGIEFLESVLASGLYTVAGVLLVELGGGGRRVLSGVLLGTGIYIGEIIFGLLAIVLRYWKYLIIAVYSPLVMFIFYIYILKESTRWQLLRGKIVEAKETFKLIAKMNKLSLTEKQISDISGEELCLKLNVVEPKEKESFKDILKSKAILIRLAVMSFTFFSSNFMYIGLTVNSVFLPGDKYINFLISALASIPGVLITLYCFTKYERRICLQISYVLSAVFIIAHSYTPVDIIWLKLLLFLCGKMTVVICMIGICIYTIESFPTNARGTLVGLCNTAARTGTVLAPLTPLLTTYLEAFPSLLFMVSAVISALLLSFTPETKNQPIFDTIKQIETYEA